MGDEIRPVSEQIVYEVIAGDKWLSVDKTTGVIEAVAVDPGKAKTTAKVQVKAVSDGDVTKTAVCEVTIVDKAVPVASVKISPNKLFMGSGTQASVAAVISPVTADNQSLSWTSSAPAIAEVENGLIKALSAGKATITAETQDGSRKKATVAVTVGNPVDSVTIDAKAPARLVVSKSSVLKAVVKGANGQKAANSAVTWAIVSAQDTAGEEAVPERIATINEKTGKVTAKGAGTVVIRATAETPIEGEAKTAEHTLTTYIPVSKLTADKKKETVSENAEGWIRITTLLPQEATDKTILWESSNDNIVKLITDDAAYEEAGDDTKGNYLGRTVTRASSEGLRYKAVGAGTVKITGTTNDGGKKKITVTITVKKGTVQR
ncbi:MAG: Ig domain-containing protein [Lachnospiraceae bacterium]|nr:Ig domain-containing protein [Lachnospiraceae bacterium]